MKHTLLIWIFLLGCCNAAFSQNLLRNYQNLSKPEKKWVLLHPIVAKKAYRITQMAVKMCSEVKTEKLLDQENNGGKLDAFRHSYWMAILVQKIGKRRSEKLGLAHEKGNRILFEKSQTEDGEIPDSISCAMDLFNNQQGILIGQANKEMNATDLKYFVIKKIQEGNMKITAKNKLGQFIDCNEKVIPIIEMEKKWKNNKCLVLSNYTPH